jgi:hypothetical protein
VSSAPDSRPGDAQVTSGTEPAGDRVPGPGPAPDEEPDRQPPEALCAHRLGGRAAAARQWFPGSAGGQLWTRLQALDFMNRALLLAAVLLLCFVPFMIVVESLAGRSVATTVIRRFGLDGQAADAVSKVFTSSARGPRPTWSRASRCPSRHW